MSERRADAATRSRELGSDTGLDFVFDELTHLDYALQGRLNAERESLEKGLAHLVLALIEALREVMERQALRRIDGGSLSPAKVEQLGETFILLEERMQELKDAFGFADEDLKLNLDLGSLGRLI